MARNRRGKRRSPKGLNLSELSGPKRRLGMDLVTAAIEKARAASKSQAATGLSAASLEIARAAMRGEDITHRPKTHSSGVNPVHPTWPPTKKFY